MNTNCNNQPKDCNNIIKSMICDTNDAPCYVNSCNNRPKTRAGFSSTMLIKNGTAPELGDTIEIYDEANPGTPKEVTLDCENYAEAIHYWRMLQQYNCNTDVVWFPNDKNGFRKGMRPTWEPVLETNPVITSQAETIAYTATAEYTLANYLNNTCWFNGFVKNLNRLSVINFTNNFVEVINYKNNNQFNKLTPKGAAMDNFDNPDAHGTFTIAHEVESIPCPIYAQDLDKFSELESQATAFTFDAEDITFNGLAKDECGGKCPQFSATLGTAFDLTVKPEQSDVSTCLVYELYDNCGNDIPDTLPLTIDSASGKITGLDTLPAGEYSLTVGVKNQCCITGNTCIKIIVK